MTPETLPRHELVGLHTRVAAAAHEGYVGVAGRVVDETANTLYIEGSASDGSAGVRVRQVPKAAATFEFRLPDDSSGDASARATQGAGRGAEPEYVTVAGDRLVARPARRTERRGDSIWR